MYKSRLFSITTNFPVHSLYVFAITWLLVSCAAGDASDLRQFVNSTRAQPPGKISPLPQPRKFESHIYDADTLRNPFILAAGPGPDRREDCPQQLRAKSVLEQSPLDSLTMVGSLTQNNERWVLVRDPQHTVHRVKTGHYLGQNDGRITKISDTEVIIEEQVFDRLQGCVARQTILALTMQDN